MNREQNITLAQGGGGAASARLIDEEIVSRFGKGRLAGLPDAATLPGDVVFSTDSFVVTPRFFPGGNVGKLAVCGTVNDILVAGGVPAFLSLALVLEEGFSRGELGRILDAVQQTAEACGVAIVTGDTKVVPAGAVDGVFLNTAGIGFRRPGIALGRERFAPGDRILVSGPIGDHGCAVLAARHGMTGEALRSDCACVGPLVDAAFAAAGIGVKLMRDPTRGGTGAVLTELLKGSACGATLEETALPVAEATRAFCSMTGIDPLFVPCEGRVVAICSADAAEAVLAGWRQLPDGAGAAIVGTLNDRPEELTIRGAWGGENLVVLPEGDPLPRIC